MKCPICQAKLLPVDGELFCLQCGNVVEMKTEPVQINAPVLEETTDPLLQRAIVDAVHHEMHFRLPVAAASPRPVTSFASVQSALALPRATHSSALEVVDANVNATATAPGVSGVNMAALGASEANAAVAVDAEQANDINLLKAKMLSSDEAPSLPLHPVSRRHPAFRAPILPAAWTMGLVVLVAFVLVNVGLKAYFADRVYPGVKVGQVVLGGQPLGSLPEQIGQLATSSSAKIQVVDSIETANVENLLEPDVERLMREVRDVGRTTPLPLAGIIQAMLARPIEVHYTVRNEQKLAQVVDELATKVNRQARDAALMIVDGSVVVIPEREGREVDRNESVATLRTSVARQADLILAPKPVVPRVSAKDLGLLTEDVKVRLGLRLELKVKSAVYNPTPQQIGSWLVVDQPAKGVVVDGSKVASYVATIPGRFDRMAATSAFIEALQSKQNLTHIASTRRNVSIPKLPVVVAPELAYSYCTYGASAKNQDALKVAMVNLSSGADVPMLGNLKFGAIQSGCHLSLAVVETGKLATTKPDCAIRAICVLAQDVAISEAAWNEPPRTWTGTLEGYRSNLVSQAITQWLSVKAQ